MEVQPTAVIENKTHLVRFSFYNTYAFLLTTATITFIEAMRNPDPKIRHILNLETVISVVAAFFYSQFVERIKDDQEIDYRGINITRYTDWAITTPVMLLVLVLAMLYNSKKGPLPFSKYLMILFFNFVMLGFGYMGEMNYISKNNAQFFGSIFFFALYGYIYYHFLKPNLIFDNRMIYWVFVFFWALYGVFYQEDDETRNIAYNFLDLFAKCFVGIFFWAYFTKIFSLK